MSSWCSGHHICLTRRRSLVRAQARTNCFSRLTMFGGGNINNVQNKYEENKGSQQSYMHCLHGSRSVVVITSASHAEGPWFEPRSNQCRKRIQLLQELKMPKEVRTGFLLRLNFITVLKQNTLLKTQTKKNKVLVAPQDPFTEYLIAFEDNPHVTGFSPPLPVLQSYILNYFKTK
ncbi:hypothetical protein T01_1125 [Trichinella spiralis]|uniref:Uncharacterized protein n=1 Tax=Trichinella spiralis TaxID=6334 RepID=A0A0V1B2Q4_TRISP|nr:hypothetical protein T01_1125 [Trichinella spiralis]